MPRQRDVFYNLLPDRPTPPVTTPVAVPHADRPGLALPLVP